MDTCDMACAVTADQIASALAPPDDPTWRLAALCYLAIEPTGLQSLLLAFPELLAGAIVVDIVLGKWRGLRLLEYLRFFDLTRRSDRWAP